MKSKASKWICIGLLSILCLLSVFIILKINSETKQTKVSAAKYETILNGENMLDIQIDISDENWDKLTKDALKKDYYSCNITINGEQYKNVGIRTKGSASLETVAETQNSDRYSLMIKFNKYVKGQKFHGLTKLALNNMISDYTQMRDTITYDMAKTLELEAPLFSYAKITKNGKYFGCYLALEPVDKSFCERSFGSSKGALYAPTEYGETNSSGSLNYLGDDVALYDELFEDSSFGSTDESKKQVIDALKAVSKNQNIEEKVDVNNVLKFMALQTMVVNLDSHTGKAGHNTFLYVMDGKIHLIPWDYNLAYGLYMDSDESGEDEDFFGFLDIDWDTITEEEFDNLYAEYNKCDDNEEYDFDYSAQANQYVNFPIDTPYTAELSNRQFFMKLLENDKYMEQYHEYLRILSEDYAFGGTMDKTIKCFENQIGDLVGTESNAFITNDTFKQAVPEFKKLLTKRAEAIQGQLLGNLPATWGEQLNNPAIIDCYDVKLELTRME